MALTFYHNPRCSKSRAALELLRGKGAAVRTIEYLKTPLDADQLAQLAQALGGARALVRDNEEAYRAAGLDASSSDAAIIAAIVAHPILLQRPILQRGKKAVVGRPPEAILALL